MNKPIFAGEIDGFPEILIDYFLGPRPYAFFLSHCHADHIVGLDTDELKHHLAKNAECRIYCTTITKCLILRRTGLDYLASHLHTLSLDEQHTLPVSSDNTINVTLFDAFHCPGSAMFLLSRPGDVVLYTGDFRLLGKEEYYTASLTGYQIASLYLDTTFFSPREPAFREFPSRALSEEVTVDFIRKKRSEAPGVEVHIDVTLGWENIFLAIANKFDIDIQTTAALYSEYSEVVNILFVLTLGKSWVHVNRTFTKICEMCTSNTIRLRPSSQWKLHNNVLDRSKIIVSKYDDKNFFYIAHSMHSSYRECKEFIKLVGAGRVHPIAVPGGMNDRQLLGILRGHWQEDDLLSPMSSISTYYSDSQSSLQSDNQAVGILDESSDYLPVPESESRVHGMNKGSDIEEIIQSHFGMVLVKTENLRTNEVIPPLQSDQEEEEGNLSEVSEESSDCPPVLVPCVEGLGLDIIGPSESREYYVGSGSDSDVEIVQSREVVVISDDSDSDDGRRSVFAWELGGL